MTIRLRCTECQRKLKVPEEALGKKIQCPACGARFIGRLDTSSPPPPPLEMPPAIEPVFQDMAPAPVEEAAAPLAEPQPPAIEEPAPVPVPPEPAPSPFPNLQLEEVPSIEPVEPIGLDEPIAEEPIAAEEAVPVEEPIGIEEVVDVEEAEVTEAAVPEDDAVDPIVMEEEPVMDVTTAADETDAVDVVDEAEEGVEPDIVDEDEAEEAKPKPRKKKSRGLLCGCLAALGLFLVAGGVGGFFGYRWWTGYISDDDWKTFSNPEAQCSVSMPGTPTPSTEAMPPPGTQLHKFIVEKPWARSDFTLLYSDVPSGSIRPNSLDEMMQSEIINLTSKLQATQEATQAISLGSYKGKEARLAIGGGRKAIVRFYVVPRGQQTRIYELVASGPDLKLNDGPGSRFFNSFHIIQPLSGPPRPGPQPGPGPRR